MCGASVPSVCVGVFICTKTNPVDLINFRSSNVESSRIKYISFFINIIQGAVAYKGWSLEDLNVSNKEFLKFNLEVYLWILLYLISEFIQKYTYMCVHTNE